MRNYFSLPREIITKSEILINKSRFLGFCKMVKDSKEAVEFIKSIKKEYSNATHIVYAYRLFETSKSTDDGEPSGTAGRPILEYLTHKNVFQLVVVVVRYFGGIKLGTGGLVRAYLECAEKALQDNLVEWHEVKIYKYKANYNEYQDFLGWIKNKNIQIKDLEFLDTISGTVVVSGDYDLPKNCELVKNDFDYI